MQQHPDECLCENCCRRGEKMTTSLSAREYDDEESDDDMGGNTLDVTDMAMMGVVLMVGGRDRREEEEAAPAASSDGATTTRHRAAQSHPADCLCEACCRAQMAAEIAKGHPDDCECEEECCRRLTTNKGNKGNKGVAPTTINQSNDGSGVGVGRDAAAAAAASAAAAHHQECLCELCCRRMVLRNIAAQDERDRQELGRVKNDEVEEEEDDDDEEDGMYYDYEYDNDDDQMYGWVGTDTNAVGGGRPMSTARKFPSTANHASSKKKPCKQRSATASSRSGTKRRRATNPADTLAVGAASTLPVAARTSTPLLLPPNDNPAESLRRALLVNDDDLGILRNRGVLQAIIDAVSSELLLDDDDGFPSSRDRVRMTDIAQLARQVMDAATDGGPA